MTVLEMKIFIKACNGNREFDCYVGISKFDIKQMQEIIEATIDYGVELGIPYAELDNMKGAYDL